MDAEGEVYFSSEGCTQGDPLGPFLFAIGYHWQLLEVQAMHPGTTILCYLDDTYYVDVPAEGLAALRDGEVVSEVGCGVRSNRPKQEVFLSLIHI